MDLRWIEEETKINQIEDFAIIPEWMSCVTVHYVYVNLNSEIEDRIVQTVDLQRVDGKMILPKEQLLFLIQNNKIYTPTSQYKWLSGLIYNVDILPSHLQSFIREDLSEKSAFLREISILDDVVFPPSLPLFHSINGLYLFFKETLIKSEPSKLVKPILKLNLDHPPAEKEDLNEKKGKTKRVRIQSEVVSNKSKKKRIYIL
jgi:hypothetical protein